MPCYHPLKAFPVGFNPSGKVKYKICSYDIDHVEVLKNGSAVPCVGSFRGSCAERVVNDFVEIPCGKCVGCRLEYSRQWANRCMLEMQYYNPEDCWFVTLTYDDAHLPVTYCNDPDTGEAFPVFTTSTRDVQLFFKRLRKRFSDCKIRYFGCSEYGPANQRPHYHFILFGLHLDDVYLWSRSKLGYQYFRSPSLERVWSFPVRDASGVSVKSAGPTPAGFVMLGHVDWDCCAYVARYVMKKLYGDDSEFYDQFNLERPRAFMSRKPGIGRQYYDDNKYDVFGKEYINLSTSKGGLKFRPPKYYQDLFELDEPDWSAQLKESRKARAEDRKQAMLSQTDLDYQSMLLVAEQSVNNRIKVLKRKEL